jgi:hypothetical protein
MAFSATISLSSAGADTGPFNLYSNADSYVTAFASAVPKASILAGYLSNAVPDLTTICRVKSTGTCTNYVDMPIDDPYIYVYQKCGTTQYFYNPGVIAVKVQDDNSPTPNCYEKVNEGLLSAMDVLYALTLNLTLVSSTCDCV